MRRALNVAFALALTMGVGQIASAQDPAQPADPQQPQEQPIPEQAPAEQETATQTARGELSRVDADTKMLTVKTADGSEMEFSYNDETEVTGAQEGVAGLATASGSQVVVEYESDGTTHTATKIEVQPSQQ